MQNKFICGTRQIIDIINKLCIEELLLLLVAKNAITKKSSTIYTTDVEIWLAQTIFSAWFIYGRSVRFLYVDEMALVAIIFTISAMLWQHNLEQVKLHRKTHKYIQSHRIA